MSARDDGEQAMHDAVDTPSPRRLSRPSVVARLTLHTEGGVEMLRAARDSRQAFEPAGAAPLCQLLGAAIQSIGGGALERRIRAAIEDTHASTIRAIHARGLGALVVIRVKELRREDVGGMRATALVDIRIHPGVSPEDALRQYQARASLLAGPGEGWRMRAPEFVWIA